MTQLAAVVLAAGASSRFGPENKLTALIGGQPLVRRVADAILPDVAEVVVVTGHERAQIEQALAGLTVRFAVNGDWQSGLGSSIATGVAALGSGVDGVFIVPGDMAFLSAALLRSLAWSFAQGRGQSIVYPTTPSGEQRNPVLWPRRFFPRLCALAGADGGKGLLKSLAGEARAVPFADAAVFTDVDTRVDLEVARHLAAGLAPSPRAAY